MPTNSAPDTVKTGAVQSPTIYQRFHATMLERAQATKDSGTLGQDVMESQISAILSAETEQDIWRADMGGTVQARDAHGLEVRILDFRPTISNRDDLENTHGYYVTMSAVVLGGPSDILQKNGLVVGQSFALQTGAELFVVKVAAFEAAGLLPKDGTISAIRTQSGNDVIKFWPMPERTVPAS